MKHFFTLLFAVLLWLGPGRAAAQKENNIWTFGYQIGLDFNSGAPVYFGTSMMATEEGCAAICDIAGNLLFYSNGQTVYNRSNTMMPNGSGILGNEGFSSTQGVGIFPVPDQPGLYYLFTLSSVGAKEHWLRYSVIDMSLNGGMGDIIPAYKNIAVDSGMSEKMVLSTMCGHAWLITHHKDKALFYAYALDGSIALSPPVVSATGTGWPWKFSSGEMKINRQGNRLALCNHSDNPETVELYDFDHASGIVSGVQLIDSFRGSQFAYGIEFSPDGSKLYTGILKKSLYQYDLSLLPSASAVRASRNTVSDAAFGSLRIGPDGMIYGIMSDSNRLGRVRNPDAAGTGCNFEPVISGLPTVGYYGFNLGMYINGIPDGNNDTLFYRHSIVRCGTDPVNYPTRYSHVLWNDGDTSRNRLLKATGTYVLYGDYNNCITYADSITLSEKPLDTTYYRQDTVVCVDHTALIRVPGNYDTYLWQDGSVADSLIIDAPQKAARVICNRRETCITDIYDYSIYFNDTTLSLLPTDTVICAGDTLPVDLTIAHSSYLWQDGNRSPVRSLTTGGIYWVAITADGCTLSDTMRLLLKEAPGSIGNDTVLCDGDALTLTISPDRGSYLWQDGSTGRQYTVSHEGTYSVYINNEGCALTRSVDIRYNDCSACVAIDNAFTPNNDMLNDEFIIHYRCPVKQQQLLVYDRWGKQVFRSESSSQSWNGKINGANASAGTYFYLLKVTFDIPDTAEEIFKGDITLIR